MPWAFNDGLVLDPVLYELRRAGRPVPLEPQAFDVLSYLVSHRDRVVSKQELMDAIWGGRFVTDAAVTSRIKQVRRAWATTAATSESSAPCTGAATGSSARWPTRLAANWPRTPTGAPTG
ncbi:MAG TPA: winged helix-turn-helix domain-containing protein [Acidothermaceae bacterium]